MKDIFQIISDIFAYPFTPPRLKECEQIFKKIKEDRNKTDAELLESDWKEIGKDFDKVIGR